MDLLVTNKNILFKNLKKPLRTPCKNTRRNLHEGQIMIKYEATKFSKKLVC